MPCGCLASMLRVKALVLAGMAHLVLTRAAYQVQRVVGAREIRAASTFLCNIFQDEGVIDASRANLNRHIEETSALLTQHAEFGSGTVAGFRSCLIKVSRGGGEWVGFGELLTDNATPRRRAVLQNLAVSPKCRRLGLGTLIVEEACRIAGREWNFDRLRVNVEDDNEAALRFYASLGFEPEHEELFGGFGSTMMSKSV